MPKLPLSGALVLVVGPSGAGKDALIGAARRELATDERFLFVRRIVTREAVAALEDHDTLDAEQFALRKRCGGFAVDWQAHGLSYALPASLEAAMMVGRVAIANVSRTVIEQAMAKYRHCHVMVVTAPPSVRAERLRARGRETYAEIKARLAREGAALPSGVLPIIIDNSGPMEDGLRRFLKELRRIAG